MAYDPVEYHRKYYQENKEKIRKKQAQYYQKNKEEIKTRLRREWHKRNKATEISDE